MRDGVETHGCVRWLSPCAELQGDRSSGSRPERCASWPLRAGADGPTSRRMRDQHGPSKDNCQHALMVTRCAERHRRRTSRKQEVQDDCDEARMKLPPARCRAEIRPGSGGLATSERYIYRLKFSYVCCEYEYYRGSISFNSTTIHAGSYKLMGYTHITNWRMCSEDYRNATCNLGALL